MKAQLPKGHKPLSKIFWFGKYKGHHIDDVFEEDPAYLGWCIEEGIEFMDNLTDEQKEIAEAAYYDQQENSEIGIHDIY